MSDQHFEKELATYERHKEELVSVHEGRFVLIQGDQIAGIWDTYQDALEAGYKQFGLTPFMVKQIRGMEQIQCFTRDIVPCQS
jgi:hypothetical protein